MKQYQILAIAIILSVQQLYFLNADEVTIAQIPKIEDKNSSTTAEPPTNTSTTVNPKPTKPTAESTTPTKLTTTTTTPEPTTKTTTNVTTSSTEEPTTTPTTPTVAPSTTTTPKPPPSGRHFDTSSFIGGIVLTIGLIAIGFVAHKIYKSKFDRNYHTL